MYGVIRAYTLKLRIGSEMDVNYHDVFLLFSVKINSSAYSQTILKSTFTFLLLPVLFKCKSVDFSRVLIFVSFPQCIFPVLCMTFPSETPNPPRSTIYKLEHLQIAGGWGGITAHWLCLSPFCRPLLSDGILNWVYPSMCTGSYLLYSSDCYSTVKVLKSSFKGTNTRSYF